jgi:hypothetical protein
MWPFKRNKEKKESYSQELIDRAMAIHEEKDLALKAKNKGKGYAPHQEQKSIDQILEKLKHGGD